MVTDIKKDFIDIEDPNNPKKNALIALGKVEQEYTKARKPFDGFGARNDFEDFCRDYEVKLMRAHKNKTEAPPFKVALNWHDYGKPSRFELVGTTEEVSDPNMKTGHPFGQQVNVQHYVSKESGMKIRIHNTVRPPLVVEKPSA